MKPKIFDNPDEIKGFIDKIQDELITIGCTADVYYRMYNKLIKAVEVEYGEKAANKMKKAAVLAAIDDVYEKCKEDNNNG